MDIALTFDEGYGTYVHPFVESLLEHHPAGELSFWFLVAPDVSQETRTALRRQIGHRGQARFLECDHTGYADLPLSTDDEFTYVSTATYLRLQLAHLLPAGVDRVLYLDCDILCTGPLDELAATDLRGNTIAAVGDPYCRRLSDMEGLPGLAEHPELDPRARYFNSGVLLIDVRAWLDGEVTPRCLDYIHRHRDQTRFLDQDALNHVLYGKWLQVDKRWNHAKPSRLEPSLGGSLAEATLVHQIGPRKYWDPHYPGGERKSLYESYAAKARVAIEAAGAA
ncbi:glycosyltransferase family 8 protein [Amycolatopsis sp. NPDC005003]